MIVKYYGIFDSAAQECISIMPSKNDEVAKRSVAHIVREQGFDRIAGRDYVLEHLFDIDTETRQIVDNSVSVVCSFGQEVAQLEQEEKEAKLMRMLELQSQSQVKEKNKK